MKFNYGLLTHSPERLNVISTKLGTGSDTYTDVDVGKAVKFGGVGAMVVATAGAEIEGFIDNIDAGGTVDGHTFGGVARCNRGARFKAAIVPASTKVVTANSSYVVAAAQEAVGTAMANGAPLVQLSASDGTTVSGWRVMAIEGDVASVTGDGTTVTTVIIERQ